jgi:hypothetical protein
MENTKTPARKPRGEQKQKSSSKSSGTKTTAARAGLDARAATRTAPASPYHRPLDSWESELAQRADAAMKRRATIPADEEQLVGAVTAVIKYLRDPQQAAIATVLAKKGLDAAYCQAGESILTRLATLHRLPLETGGTEVLTPAERATKEAALACFQSLRQSTSEAASTLGLLDEVHVLGRGFTFANSVPGILSAVQQFNDNAATREELLAEAGIGAEELGELAGFEAMLKAIKAKKKSRVSQRQLRAGGIDRLLFSLEFWVSLYRSRARTALRSDPQAFAAAVSFLPRKSERRAKPTAEAKVAAQAKREAKANAKAEALAKKKAAAEAKAGTP